MSAQTTVARCLSSIPIALTLLPLIRTGIGSVRIWDFPRMQIAALGLVAQAAMLRSSNGSKVDRLFNAVLAGCIAYQASKIIPYTPLYPREVIDAADVPPERRIKLLTANILMTNRRADLVHRVIAEADPDVICLLEPDEWWEQQLRPIEKEYRFVNKCPTDNTYGMLLYSRLPILKTETRFLVTEGVPSMRSELRLRSGEEIVLHCVHPQPPLPGSPTYGRDAELVVVGNEAACETKPTIVMGDLNDVAWSYTTKLFQRVSGTLDPRIGRGMYNSFHASHPLLRYPLDHVFHSNDFALTALRRLPHAGSDHFPIFIELGYSPKAAASQEEPRMTEGDREAAREILDDAREENLEADPSAINEAERGLS